VSRISEPIAQSVVQPVLGIVEARRDVETQLDQPRAADGDEQRLVGHGAGGEVAQTHLDEIAAGK